MDSNPKDFEDDGEEYDQDDDICEDEENEDNEEDEALFVENESIRKYFFTLEQEALFEADEGNDTLDPDVMFSESEDDFSGEISEDENCNEAAPSQESSEKVDGMEETDDYIALPSQIPGM